MMKYVSLFENFDNYSNLDDLHKFASSQKDRNKIISHLSIVSDEHKERSHSMFFKIQSIFSEKKLKKNG